jgi:hypothetical protein
MQLAAGMQTRGFELSHGEQHRTQNAVVLLARGTSLAVRARARALAEQLQVRASALSPPPGPEAFEVLSDQVLREVAHRVEMVPPIDASGRYNHGSVVPPYAQAAARLFAPGQVSPVVETDYGYHVLVLRERLPAVRRPDDEVLAAVRSELVVAGRQAALGRLVAQLRQRYGTQVRLEALRASETMRLSDRPTARPRSGS